MTTFIDASSRIGPRTVIWHFAVILANVVIGADCSIGSGTEIGRGSTIGDLTRISAHVFLPSNSRIGQQVFIGPGVICTDDRYPCARERGEPPYVAQPPTIEDGAIIGAGSVILPGVVIGHHAFVGAGAIVTQNVPSGILVRGEAARPHLLRVGSR